MTRSIRKEYNLRDEPMRYNTLANARRFAARAKSMNCVMHGDDNTFWVCTLADRSRLIRHGIEDAAR